MLRKYILIQLIVCCGVFFIACKNEKKEPLVKKNTTEIQKDGISKKEKYKKVIAAKISKNPIYNAADELNMIVFGKKLKHLDFTSASKKIPKCVAIFDFKELVKIRAFKEPRFNKNYIPNYLDNYVYIIFEYPTEAIAQKILQEYSEQVKIMGQVETDEISLKTISERQKTSFNNSKFGGIIFNSTNNIIYIKESCSAPNTLIHMQWSTYEKVFLNSFEHQQKDSIVGTVCGISTWDTYIRE